MYLWRVKNKLNQNKVVYCLIKHELVRLDPQNSPSSETRVLLPEIYSVWSCV